MSGIQKSLTELKHIFIRDTKRQTIAAFVTLAYLMFQSYRTFIRPLPPMLLRPINMAFIILLVFLYNPVKKDKPKSARVFGTAADIAVFISMPFIFLYNFVRYERLLVRINYLDKTLLSDRIVCILLIAFLLIGIWRVIGKALAIFMMVFIVYGLFSNKLTGILYYQGLNLEKFTSLMIMGTEGLYGVASSAASGFLFWIMIFGGLFSGGRGGQVLIDIGLKFGSRAKDNSAPAKAAVISSGLFGMISGSAAANVASTGVFTIPLMKKVGYTSEEAGAIEAVASTGGQIMPPIMGAAAFIMADMLEINYLRIASSALVPGLIYYTAVFVLVHLLAKRHKKVVVSEDIFKTAPILPRLYTLLPVPALVGAMALGATIQRAALYAILTVIVINFIAPKEERRSVVQLFTQIIEATKRTVSVGLPLCGCGVIVGIISISGLATRMSVVIKMLGSQYTWIGLLIAMFGCMMLGMALPTTAAYLTAYILFVPTLLAIGIDVLPANLFLFYFGIFAQITPPVCVASYTAAGISGGKSWDTGWKAFTYASCAFFAPFVFVYQPGILLLGTFVEIITAILTLLAGTMLITVGVSGYMFQPLSKVSRALFVIAGILVSAPEAKTDIIGFALGAVMVIIQLFARKKAGETSSPA